MCDPQCCHKQASESKGNKTTSEETIALQFMVTVGIAAIDVFIVLERVEALQRLHGALAAVHQFVWDSYSV